MEDFNKTHYVRWSASGESAGRLFHFDVPVRNKFFRISWMYIHGLSEARAIDSTTSLFSSFAASGSWPDDIVVGSGASDYDYLSRHARLVEDFDNFADMSAGRVDGATAIVNAFAASASASRLWYRNNHCNARFPALAADEHVMRVFTNAGHRVLETFNLSVGFPDMLADDFHYDRFPWVLPRVWEAKPHVGELNAQATQAMLSMLCLASG